MKILILFTTLISLNVIAEDTRLINIEHQIRLCDSEVSIRKKLHLEKESLTDFSDKEFSVYYIETKKRDFEIKGWSIRIRVKSKKTEITIKQKSTEAAHLEREFKNIICEYNLHGPANEYSCNLNSVTTNDDFNKVLQNDKNWLDLLDSEQIKLLKKDNMLFKDAFIYGTLNDNRIQWNDLQLGLITLDLTHQQNKKDNTFHEISIRYPMNDNKDQGSHFEKLIQSAEIKKCPNQIEWPVNKLDVLEILNLGH